MATAVLAPARVPPSDCTSGQARRRPVLACRAVVMSSNGQAVEPPETARTEFVAETLLPTRKGKFRLRGYRHTADDGSSWSEPTVMIHGKPEGGSNIPVRVHDACFTSEVLGSLKCDCSEQLQLALEYVQEHSPGMVIYLQQEGRGIGLANKIAAYSLQATRHVPVDTSTMQSQRTILTIIPEKGFDTVDANRELGLPDDAREYTSVVNILDDLDIRSICLITNNPRKIMQLEGLGVSVTGRIPCLVKPGKYSSDYLEAKGRRMDHLDLDGSWCYWDHGGDPTLPSDKLGET